MYDPVQIDRRLPATVQSEWLASEESGEEFKCGSRLERRYHVSGEADRHEREVVVACRRLVSSCVASGHRTTTFVTLSEPVRVDTKKTNRTLVMIELCNTYR